MADPICPLATIHPETSQKFQSVFSPPAPRLIPPHRWLRYFWKSNAAFGKPSQHVFPWGPLHKLRHTLEGVWERPRCTWCLVQGVSPAAPLVVLLPFLLHQGPALGCIVTSIPSLGHSKSPTECQSVGPSIFVRLMRRDKQTPVVLSPCDNYPG